MVVFNNSGIYGGDRRADAELGGPYASDPAPTDFVSEARYGRDPLLYGPLLLQSLEILLGGTSRSGVHVIYTGIKPLKVPALTMMKQTGRNFEIWAFAIV